MMFAFIRASTSRFNGLHKAGHCLAVIMLLLPAISQAEFSLRGTMLAAHPDMQDQRFAQTVVLLIEHNKYGAYGLIVNRPTDITLQDVSPDLVTGDEKNYGLGFGGPVQPKALSMLLLSDDAPSGMLEVLPNFHFTRDAFTFDYVVDLTPSMSDLRILFGHASWVSEQLESEIERGAWLIVPGDAQKILQSDAEELWLNAIEAAGETNDADSNVSGVI